MSNGKPGDTFHEAQNRDGGHLVSDGGTDPLAEKLFGNPGGEPGGFSEIRTALGSGGFDSIAYAARFDGDHNFAKALDKTRNTLAGALNELGISRDSAQQIAVVIKDFYDKPRAKESHQKNFESAMETLWNEWGGDNVEANLAGATELLGALRAKDPWFNSFLSHTGMQGDERLLRILGNAARHRKATAKK